MLRGLFALIFYFLQKKLDISRPLYDNIYRIILCGQAAAYARVSRRTYAGAHP